MFVRKSVIATAAVGAITALFSAFSPADAAITVTNSNVASPGTSITFSITCDVCTLLGALPTGDALLGTSKQLDYYNATYNSGPDLTSTDIAQTTTSGAGDQNVGPIKTTSSFIWFQVDGKEGAVVYLANLSGGEATLQYTGTGAKSGLSHYVTSAVPLPAAGVLFVSSLLGLAGLRRRNDQGEVASPA